MFEFFKRFRNEVTINDNRVVSKTIGNGGVIVCNDSALKLSAVYACVRLISQTIASLPFRVYREDTKGRKLAVGYALDRIINKKPNTNSTAQLFWTAVVSAILLRGGAYAEKQLIKANVVGLVFLEPDRLQIRDLKGVKQYTYNDRDGTRREILPSKIVYFPGFSVNGVEGLSAIQYGAAVFGSALAANTAANSSFEKGLQPTIYLKQPGFVKAAQRLLFRESMTAVAGALNAGETVVLEGGQELGTIGINQKDAQLLESRQFSIEEICRWFGVPPHMIGHANTTTWGSGIEQQMIGFLTFTLAPILTSIEQAVNNYIIPEGDQNFYFSEHITQGLLRADSVARANYYGTMVNNGLMDRDECREIENLPTRGGNAAVLTVQTALTPIDKLGEAKTV